MRNFLLLCCTVLFACSRGTAGTVPAASVVAGEASSAVAAHDALTFTSLYSFKGTPDGQFPQGPVIDVNGTLYGTTNGGGSDNAGTVFELDPGFEKVLHSFTFGSDGDGPSGRLLDIYGALYGTTASSGSHGAGTIFKVTPSGNETDVHSFRGFRDGNGPVTGLTDVHGTLYGTATAGGGRRYCAPSGCGIVYSLTRSGSESVTYAFKGAPDGADPRGELLKIGGTLYGTTYAGGSSSCNCGTVYKVAPRGAESVLHSFAGGTDGSNPQGSLLNVGGVLYGATSYGGSGGGGTIFKITASGEESVVHAFSYSGVDGAGPGALTDVNGTFYGTLSGGAGNNYGAVFSLTTSGVETLLHTFNGADGAYPEQSLTYANGTLYGMTYKGGAYGLGTIFSVTL
jgi:uncharacterized repeat protein (TIGR03803 family)